MSMREVLFVYFNHDMRQRQAELDRLTKRSHDIEALLTKRVAARQQLIELQLNAFKHEAEGLGLISERRTVPRAQGSAANAAAPGIGPPGMMSNLGGGMDGGYESRTNGIQP